MDPLSLTASLATVVGLVSDFVSHRKLAKAEDYDEFLQWLEEHRHSEIVGLLQQQSSTTISIKALLAQDREELRERLALLDGTIAAAASAVEGLQGVVEAVRPGASLSGQSLDILKQFRHVNASKATPTQTIGEKGLLFLDGMGGMLCISDARFLEDDLQTLVDAGLLRLTVGSAGNLIYMYTRRAEAVVLIQFGDET